MDRADSLLASALIVDTLMMLLDSDQVLTPKAGLGHALLSVLAQGSLVHPGDLSPLIRESMESVGL